MDSFFARTMRMVRSAGRLLGIFILANAAGEMLFPGFAVDHFWSIASRALGPLQRPLAVALGAALLLPDELAARRRPIRRAAAAVCALFAVLSVADALRFWWLLGRGRISTPAVVPFSALVAAVLTLSALRAHRARELWQPEPPGRRLRRSCAEAARTAGLGLLAALAFIFTYGPTDYARPADCAVVLGSRVYRSGEPSLALRDRAMTAIDLYNRGVVGKLVMSGGVDRYPDGLRVSEAEVCRQMALREGVPDEDIIVDELGVNSWATVNNVREMAARRGWHGVLLVSHYYHLPRLRLAADRAGLRPAHTVPCRQTRRLRREPWGVARECAGLAYYYLFRLPVAEG